MTLHEHPVDGWLKKETSYLSYCTKTWVHMFPWLGNKESTSRFALCQNHNLVKLQGNAAIILPVIMGDRNYDVISVTSLSFSWAFSEHNLIQLKYFGMLRLCRYGGGEGWWSFVLVVLFAFYASVQSSKFCWVWILPTY